MTPMTLAARGHHGHPAHLSSAARAAGPAILCLHCSTGSSRQWRALAAQLDKTRAIIAPDLLGYGENPAWPRGRRSTLALEVARVLEHIPPESGPVDVVAHSFGAAVAVKLALTHGEKVRSLTLYEPVLFGLLREDMGAACLAEIFTLGRHIEHALSGRDMDGAARQFIDFWSGAGSWDTMAQARRQGVRDCIDKVRADFEALLADETNIAALASLEMPVLCLSGGQSPGVTRRIAQLLARTVPRIMSKRFENAGHMGPLTHADEVNACIDAFLSFLSTQPIDVKPHTAFSARAA